MLTNFSESQTEITKALSALQAEITDPKKDTSGYGYKYATLDQVLAIVRPLMAKHGLAHTQMVTSVPTEYSVIYVSTRIMHVSGEYIEAALGMPIENAKGMSKAQSIGSVITYARLYALQSILGIAAEEDTDAASLKSASKGPDTVLKVSNDIEDFI